MPRQTPSDQGYPETIDWTDSRRQPPRNGSSTDADQARPHIEQALTAAVPPPAVPVPPPAPAQGPAPTRRSILRGVAGIGVVGAAAAVGAGAAIRLDKPAEPTLKPVGKPVAMAPMAPSAMAGPLVVYVADTTNGLLDVYGGTGATQIRNPALVRQLLANLKLT